jgi:hypothetical protein
MSCRVYRSHLLGRLQGQHSRVSQPLKTANERRDFHRKGQCGGVFDWSLDVEGRVHCRLESLLG